MKHRLEHISRIQVPTWSRPAINETNTGLDFTGLKPYRQDALKNNKRNIRTHDTAALAVPGNLEAISGIREFVKNHKNQSYYIHIKDKEVLAEPIILDFTLDRDNSLLIEDIVIHAGEDSKATVIVLYSSKGEENYIHCGHTRMHLDKGARIDLIKIQLLSANSNHLDETRVTVEEGADANLILAELGAGNIVSECDISLQKEKSKAKLDSLYIGNRSKVIDMNYRIEYVGSCSEGFITAKGVLLDECRKTFKNTLDFVTGSYGSKGREEETVISLNDKAVNISAPLLLCGEDNVEGQHASNIGRLPESKLFYLMSRGLDEREAKKLMVEASFAPVIGKIPLEAFRNQISRYIAEVMQDGE